MQRGQAWLRTSLNSQMAGEWKRVAPFPGHLGFALVREMILSYTDLLGGSSQPLLCYPSLKNHLAFAVSITNYNGIWIGHLG